MRKPSTLFGLTLFALATPARAQESAPATAVAVPPADEAATTSPPPAVAAPAPPAENVAVASGSAPAQTAPPHRKLEVGLSFLPMALGKFTSSPGGTPKTVDASFAYGAMLSVSYEVLSGLVVGLAPQYTFNVKDKLSPEAAKELDVLARVAYAYRPVETITVYAEVLPGYSVILPPEGSAARGPVLAFGAGFAMDMTDRIFVNVGGGYQIGFQNRTEESNQLETRSNE
jgi:hypothetical protein